MKALSAILGFFGDLIGFFLNSETGGLYRDRYDREAGRRQKPFDLDGVQAPPVKSRPDDRP